MRGVNRLTLMGRISHPEIKLVGAKDLKMARFGIVTEYQAAPAFSGPNKGKPKPVVTTWHNVTAWGRQADLVDEYLKKGDVVYVECRVEYNEVEDGPKYTNITVERLEFVANTTVSDDDDDEGETPPPVRKPKKTKQEEVFEDEDEDEEEEEKAPRGQRDSNRKAKSPFDPDDDDLPF